MHVEIFLMHENKAKNSIWERTELINVYTNPFSFVTATFLMRLRILFTRHLSRPQENAAKSGAFSKLYGFIHRVNSKTASILNEVTILGLKFFLHCSILNCESCT